MFCAPVYKCVNLSHTFIINYVQDWNNNSEIHKIMLQEKQK